MNPFRYGCIVAGENYCPRKELQRQLKELIASGQNVVVQGPRRMGKTSLVGETVRSIRGMRLIYVDLFCVRTAAEFCRRVVDAALKCGKGRSFLERTAALIKGLRPVFSVDRETGAPTLSIDIKSVDGVSSIEEVMDMVARHAEGGKTCVVFDEFQDVLDIPDGDVILARLRAKIQFLSAIPFVFLGSVRNRMHEIFDSPKSPFFKSAISFPVDKIDEHDLVTFLRNRFRVGNRSASSEVARLIVEAADGISGDVQELAETTWLATDDGATVGERDVEKGLEMVFARESRLFGAMISKLTGVQLSVLRGIAANEHARVFSGGFMSAYGIKNVGSVTKAIRRLVADELIFEYAGEYRFENPFFKEWLLRR